MKYIAREQIKKLFKNPLEDMANDLLFNGYEEEGEYKEWWKDENELYAHLLLKNNEMVKDYLE